MPGTQLLNRLTDLHYRAYPLTNADAERVCSRALEDGPMLIFVDLVSAHSDVCAVISRLRKEPATSHIPIIAFADETQEKLQEAGRQAGATLVVTDSAVMAHLPHLIQQALQVE